jgi:predicted dehydrogenase
VKCFHPTLRALASDMFEKMVQLTAPTGPLGPVRCGLLHMVTKPFDWATSWMLDRNRCSLQAEWGSHAFDTFMALTGDKPSSVWCHAARHCRDFDQNDVITININFAGGRFFQQNVNWLIKPEWKTGVYNFTLGCDRGVIQHDWFSMKWFSDTDTGEMKSERTETQGCRWEHYDSLCDAIERDTMPSPNHLDGLNYVRILEAAIKSSESQQLVTL